MSNEVHVGDIGTVFEVTIQESGVTLDISTATTKQIILRKPSGASMTKTAAFSTDGKDGKIRYASISGDLDVAGKWSLQAYLATPAWQGKSDIQALQVYANLS
jgi:hypothetical protein